MFLTVFTPAYNRAHTIGRTYESLRRQTCKDFCWIVVDDGSTDSTGELVRSWAEVCDNGFPIRYIYKENGGLHTGYNTAIAHMDSELAVCIDSDDFMPDNAVELIRDKWRAEGSKELGGIIGLDYDTHGNMIGGLLPEGIAVSPIEISTGKVYVKPGDKKYVVRTDLYKAVAPMKVFPGEKNFNPHYMHTEIGRKYRFLTLNREICTVDYQPDGMTANMFRQYYNSPNSFLELRKQFFTLEGTKLKAKIRNMIHFVSSATLSGRYFSEFPGMKYKLLMLLCTPPGLLLAGVTVLKGR